MCDPSCSSLCSSTCASSESDAVDTRMLGLCWKGFVRNEDDKRPCRALMVVDRVGLEGAERHRVGLGCADPERCYESAHTARGTRSLAWAVGNSIHLPTGTR
ncbi:hypothetical protein PVAP13_9NG175273 [Panicum virgatum]|uniref:Uncharacterized protein n=1 Tax=Panicum virgatum TaxID=38727 RepID=A0A8T0MHJ9_PANVG|nr:hypothetical protein PVAP13_9NG175273 [Panicum virgatum]